MNWRKEILTELNKESHLMFCKGVYSIYAGKYRRCGLGEQEVPARAVERMIALDELKIVNHFSVADIYSLRLKNEKEACKTEQV